MKDYDLGATAIVEFNTAFNGDPITIGGSVAFRCREAGTTTDISTGVTHALDQGNTGLHKVTIDTSSGYSVGKIYNVVMTVGTVGGKSQAGAIVGQFYIRTSDEAKTKVRHELYWSNLWMVQVEDDMAMRWEGDWSALSFFGQTLVIPGGQSALIVSNSTYDGGDDATVPTYYPATPQGASIGDWCLIMPPMLPILSAGGNPMPAVSMEAITQGVNAAATLAKMFDAADRKKSSTAGGYVPTTTAFQVADTNDEEYAWLDQAIFWVTGLNAGQTAFITGYSFSTRVRLTMSEMEYAPAHDDEFIKMGRQIPPP